MSVSLASLRLLAWGTFLVGLGSPLAFSAEPPPSLRSQSGQFIVQGAPFRPVQLVSTSTSNVTSVRLDPALLAVSCERIKQAMLGELQMNDQWSGTIYMLMDPNGPPDAPILVTSVRHTDGWSYRVSLPQQVDKVELIKATVQVLLLEITNRRAGRDPFDVPLWLTEGMPVYLEAAALSNLTLEPETRTVRNERNPDPLRNARNLLRTRPLLNFNELSWPSEEQLSRENLPVYQSCAHLFIHDLLRLKRGQECLREMLRILPDYLNWQTAFLRAFQPQFERLVDVDKWWSLSLVHFTGRDLMSAWPREECWRQLDGVLATSVQVRLKADELPMATQVKLQQIISEWDYARQRPILWQKVNYLQALRMRVPQDLAGLWEEYHQALSLYVQRRDKAGSSSGKKNQFASTFKILINDTVKRLDALDMQRELLRKPSGLTTVAPASPNRR